MFQSYRAIRDCHLRNQVERRLLERQARARSRAVRFMHCVAVQRNSESIYCDESKRDHRVEGRSALCNCVTGCQPERSCISSCEHLPGTPQTKTWQDTARQQHEDAASERNRPILTCTFHFMPHLSAVENFASCLFDVLRCMTEETRHPELAHNI